MQHHASTHHNGVNVYCCFLSQTIKTDNSVQRIPPRIVRFLIINPLLHP